MQNPLRGIYLNGYFYPYALGTDSERITLQNTVTQTRGGAVTVVNGATLSSFTVAINLENETTVVFGSSFVGVTQWLGLSQKTFLITMLTATGASMPILYVDPTGMTHSVIPTGELTFNPLVDTPKDEGAEYRVDLTLQEI